MSKILLVDPLPAPMVERLRPLFPAGADFVVVPSYSEADLAQYGADAEILLVIHRKVDAHVLSLVPHVRLVQRVGVGYDNLDLQALQAGGIVAAYTPGANAGASRAGLGHMLQVAMTNVTRFLSGEAPLDLIPLPGGS
jgi:phosphoglycerate dehydrogenase-like enzyme